MSCHELGSCVVCVMCLMVCVQGWVALVSPVSPMSAAPPWHGGGGFIGKCVVTRVVLRLSSPGRMWLVTPDRR